MKKFEYDRWNFEYIVFIFLFLYLHRYGVAAVSKCLQLYIFSKVAMIQIIFDVQKSTLSHTMEAHFVARTPLSALSTPMADGVIR